jgi:membrane protein
MRRLPARAWLVLRRAADALVRTASTRDAAQVAFFILLSFPATLLLIIWGASTALDNPAGLRRDIVDAVVDAIPLSDRSGRREVEELLDDVARGAGGLGYAVVPALLYSASGAIGGLRHAVNEAFQTRDDRPWVQGKLLDIGLVLVVAPIAIGGLALKLSNTVPAALDDEPLARGLTGFLLTELAPLAIAFVLLVALFRILPSAEVRLRDAWPGALVAVIGLRLAQALAEALLSLFGGAGTVYGAIGGLLAAGYAVYLACVVIVAGAHVSAQLAQLPTGQAIDAEIEREPPGKPAGRFVLDVLRGLFVRRRRG